MEKRKSVALAAGLTSLRGIKLAPHLSRLTSKIFSLASCFVQLACFFNDFERKARCGRQAAQSREAGGLQRLALVGYLPPDHRGTERADFHVGPRHSLRTVRAINRLTNCDRTDLYR